jgi:hypothetical protein
VFYDVIYNDFYANLEYKEWLWELHKIVFYENEHNNTRIDAEWLLSDPKFQVKMTDKLMKITNNFKIIKPNLGSFIPVENINFKTWSVFFNLLFDRMTNFYDMKSPHNTFDNYGELSNYLAYNFIATTELILSNEN